MDRNFDESTMADNQYAADWQYIFSIDYADIASKASTEAESS